MRTSHPGRRGQLEYLQAEEASAWIQILREPSAEQRAAFIAWLKEAPRHVHDFLFMLCLDDALGTIDSQHRVDIDLLLRQVDSPVVALRDPVTALRDAAAPGQADAGPAPSPRLRTPRWRMPSLWPSLSRWRPLSRWRSLPRRQPWSRRRGMSRARPRSLARRWLPMSAALAACFLAWLWLGSQGGAWKELQTGIGEQRSFELRDGSVIQLNARSHVAYRFSDQSRDVRLFDGEAIFRVRHEAARPFRVITREAVVQDMGTQFNVYHRSEGTLIAVVEGRVSVTLEPPGRGSITAADALQPHRGNEPAAPFGPALSLGANERVQINPAGVVESRSSGDVTDAVAWQQRRLVFRQETLGRIAQEFNRYNRRQIRLVGTATGARLYTGVFDADDPDSLALVLGREPDLVVENAADGFLIRPRSGDAAPR